MSLALVAILPLRAGVALGDETFQLRSANSASCRALGEGFQPMAGGCVRINGYIAVGAQHRFVGAAAGGVFAAPPINIPPAAASAGWEGARFETLGGERVYVQGGSESQHN